MCGLHQGQWYKKPQLKGYMAAISLFVMNESCLAIRGRPYMTPSRMAMHFDSASARATTPSKRPTLRLSGGCRSPLQSRYASCIPSWTFFVKKLSKLRGILPK